MQSQFNPDQDLAGSPFSVLSRVALLIEARCAAMATEIEPRLF